MTLAALYFTAMYVFQSSLNAAPRDDPPPPRQWEAAGGDLPQRRRLQTGRVPDRLDGDRQAAFDSIRRVELQQLNAGGGGGGRREQRSEMVQPQQPSRRSGASDVNVPPSCNASAGQQQVGEFLELAGLYLLSAFWDERPNDFDNKRNGTVIRLMTVARDVGGGPRREQLVCDFGAAAGRTSTWFYEMCENHRRPYGSFVVSCRVPDDVVDAPCVVTVVDELGGTDVDVPLRTLRPPRSVSRSFTVCVPPLFGDIDPARLVEFFEVTATLSASLCIDSRSAHRAMLYDLLSRSRRTLYAWY